MQSLRPEPAARYRNVLEALWRIARTEGVWRPMRGMNITATGAGPAHALYFACYEKLKKTLSDVIHAGGNSHVANGTRPDGAPPPSSGAPPGARGERGLGTAGRGAGRGLRGGGEGQAAPWGWRGQGCAKALCSLQPRASGAGRSAARASACSCARPSCSQVSVARRRSVASRRPPRTDARGWEPPTDERGPAAWVGGAGAHPAGSGLVVLWCPVVLGKSHPQRVCSKMLSGSSSRWVQRPSFCGTPASRWPARAGTEGVPAGPRDLTDCRAPLLLSVELFFGWDLLRTSPPSGQEMEAAFGSRPPLRGHFLLCFGGGLGVVVEPLGLSPPPPLTCGSSCFAGAAGCVATLLHDAAMNPAEGNDEPALPGV